MLTPEYAWGLFGDGPQDGASEPTPGVRSPWTLNLSSDARSVLIVMVVIGAILFVVNLVRY